MRNKGPGAVRREEAGERNSLFLPLMTEVSRPNGLPTERLLPTGPEGVPQLARPQLNLAQIALGNTEAKLSARAMTRFPSWLDSH